MRTVTDILNDVNAVYYDSLDCDRLLEGEKTLAALMRDAYVNEKNRNKALSLQMRMTAKRLLLEYIGSSFSCLFYTFPCPRDRQKHRMPASSF